ncbi:MAG: hypothetical protein M0Q91_13790 [Methanoregula sp.]|jgi:hypothetical protein|nr:hypothetical protein [Methanoregula sp.]
MKPKYEPGKNDIYTFADCPRRIKGDVCLEGAIILATFYQDKLTGSCSENRENCNCPAGFR